MERCEGGEAALSSFPSADSRAQQLPRFLGQVAALLRDLSVTQLPRSAPRNREKVKSLLEAASEALVLAQKGSSGAKSENAAAGFVFVSAAAEAIIAQTREPSEFADGCLQEAIGALAKAAEVSAALLSSAASSFSPSSPSTLPSSLSTSSSPSLFCVTEVLEATASVAKAINSTFFCSQWLEGAGQEAFAAASAQLRAALKDSLAPAAAEALQRLSSSKERENFPSLGSLELAVEALVKLGVRAAAAVRGVVFGGSGGGGKGESNSSQSVAYPVPMRSFALINVAIGGASRLLGAVVEAAGDGEEEADVRKHVAAAASNTLASLAGPTADAAGDLAESGGDASKLTPVRFWAQHVAKVAAAHPRGCVVGCSGGSFAGALSMLAGAEASLSYSTSTTTTASSSSSLSTAKGVIAKAAAAVASCWTTCASSKNKATVTAAGEALSSLLASSVDDNDDDARATAIVLLLQSSASSSPSLAPNLVARALPELCRRVSFGTRTLWDSTWREGASSAAAAALAASAAPPVADGDANDNNNSNVLWLRAERALFEAALCSPTPAARELVGEAWAGMFRRLLLLLKKKGGGGGGVEGEDATTTTTMIEAVLEAHASALVLAAAGAAALSVGVVVDDASEAPSSSPSTIKEDAAVLSEHLALLAARVISSSSTSSSPSSSSSDLLAGKLLSECERRSADASLLNPEASAAASAVVRAAAAAVASSDDGAKGSNTAAAAAASALALLREAAWAASEADACGDEDALAGVLLLIDALCAGCSPSFDEGGFASSVVAGGGSGIFGDDDDKHDESESGRGLLCLPRQEVEAVARGIATSRLVNGFCAALTSSSAVATVPLHVTAALRALAATGLPPLPTPPPPLLRPGALAALSSADPRASAAALALAPLVGRLQQQQGGAPAFYRGAIARAAGAEGSSAPSATPSPCFVALHVAAASLAAHARGGGGLAIRSCVPASMLPASASSTTPFFYLFSAVMKRVWEESSRTTLSSISVLVRDAKKISSSSNSSSSKVSAAAASRAAASIDAKVREALRSLREVEAAAEAVENERGVASLFSLVGGGGGGGGNKVLVASAESDRKGNGSDAVNAASAGVGVALLEEVEATAQRLKRSRPSANAERRQMSLRSGLSPRHAPTPAQSFTRARVLRSLRTSRNKFSVRESRFRFRPRASNGNGDESNNARGSPLVARAVLRLLLSPGLSGTLAVAGALLFKLDPPSPLSALLSPVTPEDVVVGLAAALPLVALDSLLLGPDYQPGLSPRLVGGGGIGSIASPPSSSSSSLETDPKSEADKKTEEESAREIMEDVAALEGGRVDENDADEKGGEEEDKDKKPRRPDRATVEAGRAALLRSLAASGAIVLDVGASSPTSSSSTSSSSSNDDSPSSSSSPTQPRAFVGAGPGSGSFLERTRAAAHAYSGRVVRSAAMRSVPNPLAEAALVVAARAGTEMFARAFALRFAGAWVADRVVEAAGLEGEDALLSLLALARLPPDVSIDSAGEILVVVATALGLVAIGLAGVAARGSPESGLVVVDSTSVSDSKRSAAATNSSEIDASLSAAAAAASEASSSLRKKGASPEAALAAGRLLAERVAAARADAALLDAVVDAFKLLFVGGAFVVSGNHVAASLIAATAPALPAALLRKKSSERAERKRAEARAEFERIVQGDEGFAALRKAMEERRKQRVKWVKRQQRLREGKGGEISDSDGDDEKREKEKQDRKDEA